MQHEADRAKRHHYEQRKPESRPARERSAGDSTMRRGPPRVTAAMGRSPLDVSHDPRRRSPSSAMTRCRLLAGDELCSSRYSSSRTPVDPRGALRDSASARVGHAGDRERDGRYPAPGRLHADGRRRRSSSATIAGVPGTRLCVGARDVHRWVPTLYSDRRAQMGHGLDNFSLELRLRLATLPGTGSSARRRLRSSATQPCRSRARAR